MSRIAIVNNTGIYLVRFRRELVQTLAADGHEVTIIAPRDSAWRRLNEWGVRVVELPMRQHGTNPLGEMRALAMLIGELRSLHPDVLINFTVKPAIYGSLAGWIAGVPRIVSVFTGLGYYFTQPHVKASAGGRLIRRLLRFALSKNERVVFQNADDRALMIDEGLIRDEQARIVHGSGVNLELFAPRATPVVPQSFLLVGRMLEEKGVREFVAASRAVRARFPECRCWLLGAIDENPSAISRVEIERWVAAGLVEYFGEVEDVRERLAQAAVVVLPSYREGLPRSVLEAMAMGKPVITTDTTGCRETVVDGRNGFLVMLRDHGSLAAAMERFLVDPGLAEPFGRASRALATERFDVLKINAAFKSAVGIENPPVTTKSAS